MFQVLFYPQHGARREGLLQRHEAHKEEVIQGLVVLLPWNPIGPSPSPNLNLSPSHFTFRSSFSTFLGCTLGRPFFLVASMEGQAPVQERKEYRQSLLEAVSLDLYKKS